MTERAADWLRKRSPPPPEAFRPWLEGVDAEAGETLSQTLARTAIARLDDALGLPGRDREAAFRLLAADALLTHACEAAADEESPEAAIREILERVGETAR